MTEPAAFPSVNENHNEGSYRVYNRDGFHAIVKMFYDDGELVRVEGPVFPLAGDVEGLRTELYRMQQAFSNSPLNASLLDAITGGKVKAAILDGDGLPSTDPEDIEQDGSFTDSSTVIPERNVIEEEQQRAESSRPAPDVPEAVEIASDEEG